MRSAARIVSTILSELLNAALVLGLLLIYWGVM